MSVSIGEYLNNEEELERRAIENLISNARIAIPGIVVDFNPANQTATVQPAIMEHVGGSNMAISQLLDVPVQFPRAGGYCMTFPVQSGDECLVIFADMCIDAWWQSGGVQAQMEKRRHDLSDGIAILGITSVPKAIKDFSQDTVQFRNEDKSAYVEIANDVITIKSRKLICDIAEQIEITAPDSKITSTLEILGDTGITGDTTMEGSIKVTEGLTVGGNAEMQGNIALYGTIEAKEAIIDGIAFSGHTHSGLSLDK